MTEIIDPRLVARMGQPLRAPGSERRFNCPFCAKGDTKHHLYLNIQSGLWTCHRCAHSGNWETLYRRLGIPWEESRTPAQDGTFNEIMDRYLHPQRQTEEPEEQTLYCEPPDVILIEPGSDAHGYLLQRGIDLDEITHYEIYQGVGKLGERIVFVERETVQPDSPIVFWQARAFTPALVRDCEADPRRVQKYMSPHGAKKSLCCYNLVRVDTPYVIITEGVFDAIAAGPSGVATYGKTASDRQRSRLLRAGFEDYYIAYDSDALEDTLRLAHWLYGYNRNAYIVPLPRGEDPSSLGHLRFTDCLEAAILYEPFTTMAELLRRGIMGTTHGKTDQEVEQPSLPAGNESSSL